MKQNNIYVQHHLIRPGFNTVHRKYFSKKDEPSILAYVEGLDDINFWREIFKKFAPIEINPRINRGSVNGKAAILKKICKTGKDIIICVDSDFDYLLSKFSVDANIINNHICIFQTYAYSIENLQCYANSLNELCKKISKNYLPKIEFDFNNFLQKFSEKIYIPFLYYLFFRYKNDKDKFTSQEFKTVIKIDLNSLSKADSIENLNTLLDTILDEMKEKLSKKVLDLRKRVDFDHEEFQAFSKHLSQTCLNQFSTYLFINGHLLFDSIVMPLLKKVTLIYCNEYIKYIKRNNQCDSETTQNRLKEYLKQCCPSRYKPKKVLVPDCLTENCPFAKPIFSCIEDNLKNNYDFDECNIMLYIKQDIDFFIKKYYPNLA